MPLDAMPADIEDLAHTEIDAAYRVHSYWGNRVSERVYRDSLVLELEDRGLRARKEVPLPVHYHGRPICGEVKMDLLVNERLVLELKTVPELQYSHRAHLATYLRLAELPLGLFMNFAAPRLKGNIRRVVNSAAIRPIDTPTLGLNPGFDPRGPS